MCILELLLWKKRIVMALNKSWKLLPLFHNICQNCEFVLFMYSSKSWVICCFFPTLPLPRPIQWNRLDSVYLPRNKGKENDFPTSFECVYLSGNLWHHYINFFCNHSFFCKFFPAQIDKKKKSDWGESFN